MLLAWFFALALSMGWVMAPATDAVVGAVPAARSGVASAMNNVARMVSGALGVAVIGSLISSLYALDLGARAARAARPAREAAEDSIGAATRSPGSCRRSRARRCSTPPPTRSPARWASGCRGRRAQLAARGRRRARAAQRPRRRARPRRAERAV